MPYRLLFLAMASVGAGLALWLAGGCEQGPGSAESSGQYLRPDLMYDRNALVASVVCEDRLVALTTLGYVLSVDRHTFRLMAENVRLKAVCLGRGRDGAVLAGCRNGAIVRLDAQTLESTRVAQLDSPACWVGAWRPSGSEEAHVLAIFSRDLRSASGEEVGLPPGFRPSFVTDFANGRTVPLAKRYVSTAIIDSKDRLWLGQDHGEWGGWCGYLDLKVGKLHILNEPEMQIEPGRMHWWSGNVYGFAELSDGRVLVYGGCIHFSASAYIAVTTRDSLHVVYSYSQRRGREDPVDRPVAPVTHIVEDGASDTLCVFAYSDVFRCDRSFGNWKKVAELDLHYEPGRPDAMGCYPAIRAVHHLDGQFILATFLDGYQVLKGGKQVSHAFLQPPLPGPASVQGSHRE